MDGIGSCRFLIAVHGRLRWHRSGPDRWRRRREKRRSGRRRRVVAAVVCDALSCSVCPGQRHGAVRRRAAGRGPLPLTMLLVLLLPVVVVMLRQQWRISVWRRRRIRSRFRVEYYRRPTPDNFARSRRARTSCTTNGGGSYTHSTTFDRSGVMMFHQ